VPVIVVTQLRLRTPGSWMNSSPMRGAAEDDGYVFAFVHNPRPRRV
jgi:hypothetical protein